MLVTVKVFGRLKTIAGGDEFALELWERATVSEALAQLDWIDDDTGLAVAVNREYADRSKVLGAGDEIALIPPVSGGAASEGLSSDPPVHVEITSGPIDQTALTAFVIDPRAGAVVTFTGITREVPVLQYEAYAEMARSEIIKLAGLALSRHGLCRVAVTHRHGSVKLSEASVAIAVSAPHRDEAFAGAREIIDELKLRAPIWKREAGEWLPGQLPPTGP